MFTHEKKKEFDNYLKKIKEHENKYNIFSIQNYTGTEDFINFFKRLEKEKYMHINDAMEYLASSSKFSDCYYSDIIDRMVSYSSSLMAGNMVKISKLAVYMILRLTKDPKSIDNILESADFVDYEEVCQIAIDIGRFDIVDKIFDKVKITEDQYNIIIKNANKHFAEKLLIKCKFIGLFPNEDKVYELLDRGIEVDCDILTMYNVVDDGNMRYILSKIKSGKFDFRKEKSKRFNFNNNDKEEIKTTIFENLSKYTDNNLDNLSKMFDIKYDNKCMQIFCKKYTDHKIFKYLVNSGIKPEYESMCILVNKLDKKSQIKKFFTV